MASPGKNSAMDERPSDDILEWIRAELLLTPCTSDAFIYDHMASQSGRSLPLIYQPFDPTNRGHWRDRGSVFDFLFSTAGEGARLLDLGPGDGWPSLIVAPYAGEVVGVDGSARRAQVCMENAARLGLENAEFFHVPPGSPLPFPDGSFDGAMASSSLEQTPDPRAALAEIHRVLKPGGRLRFDYEALGRYQGSQERDLWLGEHMPGQTSLIVFDRDLPGQEVTQYNLVWDMPLDQARRALGAGDCRLTWDRLSVERLRAARDTLLETRVCVTTHPSGETWARWLAEIGFGEPEPGGGYGRHSGAWFAGQRFDQYSETARPKEIATVDALLRPLVEIIVRMPAPLATDPPLTAVKYAPLPRSG